MNLPPNYKYLMQSISSLRGGGSVLDYGCGKGILVEQGLISGIPIFGCELFGAGSGTTIRDHLSEKGLLGNTVREIVDGKIPFPDETFDLVVANQVFEHIPHLEPILKEITRVLMPSGKLLCIFPVQECYRDHAGTLFAHWFLPNTKAQYYNPLFFRSLGFGRLKKSRGKPREWAAFFVQWLAENTWYRPLQEIDCTFGKYFEEVNHIEEEYVRFRLEEKGFNWPARFSNTRLVKALFRWLDIRWGDAVILAKKGMGKPNA